MTALPTFSEVRAWATSYPGPTRSVALMRVAFVLLGWAEFGEAIQPHRGSALVSTFFYAATFLALIGFRAQYTVFASGIAFLLAITRLPGQMMHHTYLLAVSTMILALTPCGRSLSVDRWRQRKGEREREEGNLWALRLLGVELTAALFWSGYNKLTFGTHTFQTAFSSGDRLEQMLVYAYSGLPVAAGAAKALITVVSVATVLIELGGSVLLWIPRYRSKALLACLAMTTFYQIALPIRAAGLVYGVLYFAFVSPHTVENVMRRLVGARDHVTT